MRRLTKRLVLLASVLVLWCAAGIASAQVGQGGAITGTVKDAQGGAVPGVTATAANSATNATVTAVTNGAGVYLITGLVPGTYKITVTLDGFNPEARLVEVRGADRLTLDITLAVGKLTEEVKVIAETPLLETASASRATSLDSATAAELPLTGRNPFVLSLVTPGVTNNVTRASLSFRPFDNGGMDVMSINGGRTRSNEYMLDGAPNSNNEGTSGNSLSFVPSPDAVQEVNVQTNTYDAQFGRTGGGVMSVTTKSGTNSLKGSAYYYLKSDSLNANLYENVVAGVPKSDVNHKQPGFTVGGPVWLPKLYDGRNRTFFFYSYEHITSMTPNGISQKAPTELEKAGNFSQSVNGVAGGLVYDPLTGQPFPGNVIPPSRINPVAAALLKYVPTANRAADSSGNNFSVSPNSRGDEYDSHMARLDQNFGNTRIAARIAHNGRHELRAKSGREPIAAPGGSGLGGDHWRWNDQISGDINSTIGNTLVSSLKVGWTRHERTDVPAGQGVDMSGIAPFAAAFMAIAPKRFTQISVTDYSGATIGDTSGGYNSLSDQYFVTEVLTKVKGRHQVKMGGEFRVFRDANLNANEGVSMTAISFNRNWTSATPTVVNPGSAAGGNAFASFLLGYPIYNATNSAAAGTATRYADAYQNWSGNYYAAFIQDDWRLTDRWMLNVGLRWDYEAPVSEVNDLSNFGFDKNAVSPLQVTGLPQLKGGLLFGTGQVFSQDRNNFGPRIGSTFRIDDNTVLRGGYGLTYLPSITDRGTLFGFSQLTPIVASTDGRTPAVTLTNPYPTNFVAPSGSTKGLATSMGQNISYTVHDRPIPEYHQWSVGVQRQLPWRSVVDLSYIGSRTNKQSVSQPINDLNADQLALGDAYLNAQVPNPFYGLLPDAPAKNGATIQRRELLRPYAQFGTISETFAPIGYYNYQALQVTWNKRQSHGVHFLVSYTLASMREATTVLNMGQAPYEQASGSNRRHNLQLSGGWQLPSFSDKSAFVKYALGGWQLNTITAFRSGLPVAMPGGVKLIGDPVLANPTRARWFNTCTLTAAGVRQNCASADEQPAFQILPSNALRVEGDRLEGVIRSEPINVDFSIFKTFPIKRTSVQFRAEIFNAFNVVQIATPNTTVTNTQFGTTGNVMQNDPRNVMLSIRIQF
jgi:hypothetical protein